MERVASHRRWQAARHAELAGSLASPTPMSAPLASPTSATEARALHDEDLLRLIPGARAHVLENGGHFYPNVHGAEFRRVMISFLLEPRAK